MNENPTPATGPIADQVTRLAQYLSASGQSLVVAESCTGGLLSAYLTDLPGSSDWFEGGWVTYSNQAKMRAFGVPAALFEEHGAVSRACVGMMAEQALAHADADYAVAISGVAGPGGGSGRKPVGTVWIGWAHRGDATAVFAARFRFSGDRAAIRVGAVSTAINGLLAHLAVNSWDQADPAHWHPAYWPESGLKT